MKGRREGEWRDGWLHVHVLSGSSSMQQLITHIHNMPHLSLVVERVSYTHKLCQLSHLPLYYIVHVYEKECVSTALIRNDLCSPMRGRGYSTIHCM